MEKAKHIGAIVAGAVGLIVIFQNMQDVDIRFLFFSLTMPNAVLLTLTLLVGLAIGVLLMWIRADKE